MNRCFIALGSNLGDRMAILHEALDELAALGRLRRPPSVYETRPVGPSSAPSSPAAGGVPISTAPS